MEPMIWWRKMWDWSYSISSIMLGFLLGVVLGNVLEGMPLDDNHEYIGGGFFEFITPFSLLIGFSSLTLFMMHGANYLILKTEGQLYQRLRTFMQKGMIAFMISYGVTTLYALLYIPHLSQIFKDNQVLFIVPLAVVLSIANVPRLANKNKYGWAFIFSSITISLLLVMVAIELYPTLLKASNLPENSITIYNAAASIKTLKIMMGFVAIGGPLVLLYTYFVYRAFWGKVKLDNIKDGYN